MSKRPERPAGAKGTGAAILAIVCLSAVVVLQAIAFKRCLGTLALVREVAVDGRPGLDPEDGVALDFLLLWGLRVVSFVMGLGGWLLWYWRSPKAQDKRARPRITATIAAFAPAIACALLSLPLGRTIGDDTPRVCPDMVLPEHRRVNYCHVRWEARIDLFGSALTAAGALAAIGLLLKVEREGES